MATFRWWQEGIIYQVYPRSFQDSNDDGIGDLVGVIQRLEYLQWLGVTAVWLSPIYPSPMSDFGYDVADYCDVDPAFGSLQDFERLVSEAHQRGLKIILDFVPNHTSSAHPWFQESRASRTNPRRNWYVWRDPAPGGGPPTNWQSEFGGSAWTLDPQTQQYYYHAYLADQPDLNWREPQVEAAMHAVLRFWLGRGVDGFRVDAIHMLIEDEQLIDNPENPGWLPGMAPARKLLRVHTADRPETHACVARMRQVLDEYKDRVMIGEAYLPIDRLMLYYGESLAGFHLPFNFHLISTPWHPKAIAKLVQEYEAALPAGGWPNWVLGNHDKSRLATRLGRDGHAEEQIRLAAMLLLTLRGTPTLYNGDEIGMRDVPILPALVQDPWEKNVPGQGLGRDPCRTPMQWSDRPHAGFTHGKPWLPVATDYPQRNVATQTANADSILSLYRKLIRLRQVNPVLSVGDYRLVAVDEQLLVFERRDGKQTFIVALNFSSAPARVPLPGAHRLILSTGSRRPMAAEAGDFVLDAFEGVIIEPAG